MFKPNRRLVLRGLLNGAAVSVALPLLNCFLNNSGTALASGDPLPVRFGTWLWGLGIQKSIFVPKKTGPNYDLPEEIASLKAVRDYVNVFTNFTAFRDGAFFCHYTGWIVGRTGVAPLNLGQSPGESIDVTIANQIGRTTRFKTLTAAATGDVRTVVSYESAISPNPPDVSPVTFYTRLFGPDFQDPNAPSFTPNPRVMARRSALSPVVDQIKVLNKRLGAEDRTRLDQYFSGIRHLEHQFDQQLTKPHPIEACHAPKAPKEEEKTGQDIELIMHRHKLLADLMAMAVACDQTRVFNMSFSDAQSNATKAGYEKPHHTTTHEEPTDPALGYQPNCDWFTRRSMESWAYFVEAFQKIKEGDGTLLDNVLIFANSDVGYARIHSMDGMAAFLAGRAGGRIKSGQHIDGAGTGITRIGYTAIRAMGLDVPYWGGKSNQTSKAVSEIVA